jgi:hypothetical protein
MHEMTQQTQLEKDNSGESATGQRLTPVGLNLLAQPQPGKGNWNQSEGGNPLARENPIMMLKLRQSAIIGQARTDHALTQLRLMLRSPISQILELTANGEQTRMRQNRLPGSFIGV